MKREKITIKAIVLIIAFIPSLNLFWDLVTWIRGYREHYTAFQFMFAAYYTLLSVFFTSDRKRFNSFWEKYPKLKNYYERILHCCAVVITSIPKYAMIILALFSSDNCRCKVLQSACKHIIRVVEFGNSDFLFYRFFNFLAHATQSIGLSSVRTLAYTFQTIELFYMQWQ